MNFNMAKKRAGNAYILVMVASMAILIVVTTALTITARSRNLSAIYGYHAGLYDLAVAGSIHAKNQLELNLQENLSDIISAALYRVAYRRGFVFDGSYFTLNHDILHEEFITALRPFVQQHHNLTLGVQYTSLDNIITDEFSVRSTLQQRTSYFVVNTRVYKVVGDTLPPPLTVTARIKVELGACSCTIAPQFMWYSLPSHIAAGVYHAQNIDDVVNFTLLPQLYNSNILTNANAVVDVTSITSPSVIIHTGDSLVLHGGDVFEGVIVAAGNVYVPTYMQLHGIVIVGGYTNAMVHSVPDVVFDLDLPLWSQLTFLDFLQVSNFFTSYDSMAARMGYVTICYSAISDILLGNCLDYYAITMVELMRTTD